jgi:hypothetical protein
MGNLFMKNLESIVIETQKKHPAKKRRLTKKEKYIDDVVNQRGYTVKRVTCKDLLNII